MTSDNSNAPTVAIISQEFARRYFPKGDAIGRQIEAATRDPKPAQIVGIVGNASVYPGQKTPDAQIYECDLQFPFTAFAGTSLMVRSQMAPSALAPMLRRAVWSVDKDQPMGSIQTMEDLVAGEQIFHCLDTAHRLILVNGPNRAAEHRRECRRRHLRTHHKRRACKGCKRKLQVAFVNLSIRSFLAGVYARVSYNPHNLRGLRVACCRLDLPPDRIAFWEIASGEFLADYGNSGCVGVVRRHEFAAFD